MAFDISIFEIDQEKGMVNLTKIAKYFNKEVSNWLKSKSTKEFLTEFAIENSDLPFGGITINKGNNGEEQGTFAVREIALELARWISPKFAVWANKQLDTLLQTGKVELKVSPTPEPLTLDQLLALNSKVILSLQAKVETLEATNKTLAPKANFVDDTFALNNTSLTPVNLVAKEIGCGVLELYKLLRKQKIWFYSLNQFGKSENNVAAKYIKNGYFVIKTIASRGGDFYDKIFATAKGKLLCYNLIKATEHNLENQFEQNVFGALI